LRDLLQVIYGGVVTEFVFGKNQCLARATTGNLEQIFERSGVTLSVYGENENNQGRKHDDVT